MSLLFAAARNALFRLDAETAHHLTLESFRRLPRAATWAFRTPPVADPYDCLGLTFPNRVGLAAGLDKNGTCLPAWAQLGFGFVEIGTVTPRPQPGNPKPRMFRLPEHGALINRLGFNNDGVDALIRNVRAADYRGILGINIGKNADTPIDRAADDYVQCLDKVYRWASYVTVNISSPNTANLRSLQSDAALTGLLDRLQQTRTALSDRHGRRVPLLVKIAPDMPTQAFQAVAQIVQERGMDGLIATNTTVSREGIAGHPLADQAGGLSGRPLTAMSCQAVQTLRAAVGPDFPLIGVGGICDAASARDRVNAGANLLQVYTAFIYEGPGCVNTLARAIAGTGSDAVAVAH
jgi:dihydroorotate dehydrogenase